MTLANVDSWQPELKNVKKCRRYLCGLDQTRREPLCNGKFAAVHQSGSGTKRRTAASHQFGRYLRHSGHAAKSSGASIRRF